MTELFIIAAKVFGIINLGILSIILLLIPISAIRYTANKTAEYDESKNKPGHCWPTD